MRIISGKYKGKTINPGKGFQSRPTTDFAKESLFNILANYFDFEEIDVLDLFSGTGSISFEFASRGSRLIESVEHNSRHASFIIQTAKVLNFTNLHVYRMNVYQYLKMSKHRFDVIFADPPYDMADIDKLPGIVLEAGLMKDNGLFVLEHSKKLDFSSHPRLKDHRNYGSVNFSIFE